MTVTMLVKFSKMFIFVSVLYNDKDFKEFLANSHEQCIVSVACSLYNVASVIYYIYIYILYFLVLDTTQFAILLSDIFLQVWCI